MALLLTDLGIVAVASARGITPDRDWLALVLSSAAGGIDPDPDPSQEALRPSWPSALAAAPPDPASGSARPVEAAATPPVRPATLTAEEEARAAQLEAQIVAEEKTAETAARRDRDRARRGAPEPVVRSGTIASRAQAEYGYVMRDVRKIVTIGGGLIVLLIGLWVVLTATGAGPI